MKTNSVLVTVLLFGLTIAIDVSAQVNLTGTHYSQNFNALSSGLPPGWSVMTNATATGLGTSAVLTTNVTSWSSTAGQFANFASPTNNDGTPFAGSETVATQSAA